MLSHSLNPNPTFLTVPFCNSNWPKEECSFPKDLNCNRCFLLHVQEDLFV